MFHCLRLQTSLVVPTSWSPRVFDACNRVQHVLWMALPLISPITLFLGGLSDSRLQCQFEPQSARVGLISIVVCSGFVAAARSNELSDAPRLRLPMPPPFSPCLATVRSIVLCRVPWSLKNCESNSTPRVLLRAIITTNGSSANRNPSIISPNLSQRYIYQPCCCSHTSGRPASPLPELPSSSCSLGGVPPPPPALAATFRHRRPYQISIPNSIT